jgi:predicted nucleic acid-binding Zn ribbon protein
MDVDSHFELEHLYLTERTCKVCGETKDLIDGFYQLRKNRYNSSSYSYECKECTIKRVVANRMVSKVLDKWEYPDW